MAKKLYNVRERITESKTKEITLKGKLFNLFKETVSKDMLGKNKLKLLNLLLKKEWTSSDELCSKLFKRSVHPRPLLSYHVNGNLKSTGLKDREMIISQEVKGLTHFKITEYGKTILEILKE